MLENIITYIRKIHLNNWIISLVFLFLTLLYMGGISKVPFHPDESTYIYMSRDFTLLFIHPGELIWTADNEDNQLQKYREIDAPLTRYLIGLGRSLAGLAVLPSDWNWSLTWQENKQNGALPDPSLLLVSRVSVALLFPLCLILLYLIGKSVDRPSTGFLAALLFASNALILLHTRRAMAESTLTFGICFAITGILIAGRKPWLAGLGIAVAFNSKQLAIALLPIGFLAVYYLARGQHDNIKRILYKLLLFSGVFLAVTFLLNPFLWADPLRAGLASIQARQKFVNQQVNDLSVIAPGVILDSPLKRTAALIAHIFIAPPAVEDVGNYLVKQTSSKATYFSSPFTHLFRGFLWGGLFTFFSVWGFISLLIRVIKHGAPSKEKVVILLASFLAQAVFLVGIVVLPFQRYWIPLIPFVCLFSAIGIKESIRSFIRLFSHPSVWQSSH